MQHIKEQNWFAVGLDVIVVIVGIFLGMQVTEWNEQRESQNISDETLSRLIIELETASGMLQKVIEPNTVRLESSLQYLEGKFELKEQSKQQLMSLVIIPTLDINIPILERELGPNKLVIGNTDLDSALRNIHVAYEEIKEQGFYIKQMYTNQIIPYHLKTRVLGDIRKLSTGEEVSMSKAQVLYLDEEYRQLVNLAYLMNYNNQLRYKQLAKQIGIASDLARHVTK
jgi:hypothetical protein